MELSQLHFAHPLWLWTALVIPMIWIVYFLFFKWNRPVQQLEKFIDPHLLPYLLIRRDEKKTAFWKPLLLWTIAWGMLTLALAGPRWDFRELETFSKDQSLVIVLDLSRSMNATDVKPSRLIRAKQKIEDVLNQAKGVKIGLIAFAADPHMITPLTDDTETIRHFLPALDTDLVFVQGSKLTPTLEMAATMLNAEPGNNKAILILSDGGFEDASALITAKKLAEKGIVVHAMGVGTLEGAPMKDKEGNIIRKNGLPIISKLEKERFKEISIAGKGHYLEPQSDEKVILDELETRATAQEDMGQKSRIWDERFYWLLLPVIPIFLWWFRRGFVFGVFLLAFIPGAPLQADMSDYFKNRDELGKKALEDGNYDQAIETFQDPYRRGVSCYRAGKFKEAEECFRESSRADVECQAAYNLGNALVQQQKYKEAITAYEDVLKKWPEHTKAQENLELVKKLLEENQQDNDNSENSDNQDDKQSEDQKDKSKDQKQNDSKKDDNDSKDEESQPQDKNDPKKDKDEPKKPDKNFENDAELDKQEEEDLEEEEKKPEEKMPKEENTEEKKGKASKTQADQDADLWLNQIENDPKTFMKNKFYIESKKNGTKEGVDPW